MLFGTDNEYWTRRAQEDSLVEHRKSNAYLDSLNRQMQESNSINREILDNQIEAEKRQQAQQYFKSLSFFLSEMVNTIEQIKDPMLQAYALERYLPYLRLNLTEAIENCAEISDKSFNKETLIKLGSISDKSQANQAGYANNILNGFDGKMEQYAGLKKQLAMLQKPVFPTADIETTSKKSILRIIGIVLLGLPLTVFLISMFVLLTMPSENRSFMVIYVFLFLVLGIPLYILAKKEMEWRKNKTARERQQDEAIHNFTKNRESMELVYETKRDELEKALLNHPIHDAIKQVSISYPQFVETMDGLDKKTDSFNGKWK